MVALPRSSVTTNPNRSSRTPAADGDGDADAVATGVLLPVDAVGEALGALLAAVHAIRQVERRASARDTS
jgi:hypothetical protein